MRNVLVSDPFYISNDLDLCYSYIEIVPLSKEAVK